MTDFLTIAFILLVAGVIAVPIAMRLGLGSVLGYLLAGMAISPLLGVLGVNVEELQHFAEFGVVMMLFLIGLELKPRELWKMRKHLLGLGSWQVVATMPLFAAIAWAQGYDWRIALAIGMIFALSSTAIVLQTLTEKRLLNSQGGQASFSVLLFQDVAVIPMLALLPLLAMPEFAGEALQTAGQSVQGADEGGHSGNLIGHLPAWAQAVATIGAVGIVMLIGTFLTRPIDRDHVYKLWALGCRDIIRETYDASLRMGRSAFEALGVDRQQATAIVDAFEEMDRRSMVEVADLYEIDTPAWENEPLIARVRGLRAEWDPKLREQMDEIVERGR